MITGTVYLEDLFLCKEEFNRKITSGNNIIWIYIMNKVGQLCNNKLQNNLN